MSTSDDEFQQRLARMWLPGWKDRFKAMLAARGYATVGEFLNDCPCRPYDEVVASLDKEFAQVQIVSCQFEEARRDGTVLNALKDSLCRHIVEQFPDGWGIGDNVDYRRASALASWGSESRITGNVGRFDQIFDCFVEEFNPVVGWMPDGPDDNVIAMPLNKCWAEVSSKKS